MASPLGARTYGPPAPNMCLVNEQAVDAQQLPGQQVILLLVGEQPFQANFPALLLRLELLDDPIAPVTALLGAHSHLYLMVPWMLV